MYLSDGMGGDVDTGVSDGLGGDLDVMWMVV